MKQNYKSKRLKKSRNKKLFCANLKVQIFLNSGCSLYWHSLKALWIQGFFPSFFVLLTKFSTGQQQILHLVLNSLNHQRYRFLRILKFTQHVSKYLSVVSGYSSLSFIILNPFRLITNYRESSSKTVHPSADFCLLWFYYGPKRQNECNVFFD